MTNAPQSPGIRKLGKICERMGCGERKVLPENRGVDSLSRPGLSSAWVFEPITSAPCQQYNPAGHVSVLPK